MFPLRCRKCFVLIIGQNYTLIRKVFQICRRPWFLSGNVIGGMLL